MIEVHETGSEIIYSEKKKHHFVHRLPASECGEVRLAAPSVRTKTPLALPAKLTHSRATNLPSASKHTHTRTHTKFRHCICLLTPSHTDTAITWKFNRTHTRKFQQVDC